MTLEINYSLQIRDLVRELSARLAITGESVAQEMHLASDELLEWIGYLHQSELTGQCDSLIDGLRSLILEAACGAAAGLYRSAIMSMRGQIDIALTWLYFKDHRIEWERVVRENKGYLLKSDVIDYLSDNYENFQKKFTILKNHKTRNIDDPYKILSAHIHSIGLFTVPDIGGFADIVGKEESCKECILLQREVTEFISDIMLSSYGAKWASLPTPIVENAKRRLPNEKYVSVLNS